jgi:hypothetical protein
MDTPSLKHPNMLVCNRVCPQKSSFAQTPLDTMTLKGDLIMKLRQFFTTLFFVLILFSQGCGSKNPQDARFQNLTNGICHDTVSSQMWQTDKSGTFKTYEEAQLYVKNLTLGGYSDWRLPTVNELYDLNYLFDLHLNGTCDFERKGKYWSGEKDGEGMAGSWEMSDQCDPARRYFNKSEGSVRAVRP